MRPSSYLLISIFPSKNYAFNLFRDTLYSEDVYHKNNGNYEYSNHISPDGEYSFITFSGKANANVPWRYVSQIMNAGIGKKFSINSLNSVSYTHLTLPTIYSV